MSLRALTRVIIIITACFALTTGNKAQAQQSRSSSACEMWLCLPGLMPDAIAAGSNVLSANCERAFATFFWRLNLPVITALPDFRNCVSSEFRNEFPNLTMRTRARPAVRPFTRWDRYSIEVSENGILQGRWSFRLRPSDSRVFVVSRWRRTGSFGNININRFNGNNVFNRNGILRGNANRNGGSGFKNNDNDNGDNNGPTIIGDGSVREF